MTDFIAIGKEHAGSLTKLIRSVASKTMPRTVWACWVDGKTAISLVKLAVVGSLPRR